jgi:hypothetical protein
MSYSLVKTFNAGSSRTGLSTVAYSIDGGTNWITTGVSELPGVPGSYKATITFSDSFAGTLSWTTGDGSPRKASEEINPNVLAPTGLDAVVGSSGDVSTMTNIAAKLDAVWRWIYKKTTMTSSQLKTYADNNTTVNTTQALSDNGTTQTKGEAT